MFSFGTGEYVVILAFTGGEGVFGIFGNENLLLIFIVSEPADKAEALVRNCFNGDLFALSENFNEIIGAYVLAVDLEISFSAYPCAEGEGLFFFKTGEYSVILAFTGSEGVFGIFGNGNLLPIFIVSEPADKAEALGRNCFNGDLFALSETSNGIIGAYVLAVDLEITVSAYPCAE